MEAVLSNIIIYRNKYVIQGRGLTPAATVYGMYLQKYSNSVENCLPISKNIITDYIVGKHHRLATNSIEILMIHLKKNRGSKTAAH
jgi:hypothetical protein